METPLKVAYFSKISESLSNGLAAKTAQNVEVCSTKILLMQDWVFRLGPLQLFAIHLSMSLVYGQSWNIGTYVHSYTYQIDVRWVYLVFSIGGKLSKISVNFNKKFQYIGLVFWG